MKSPLGGGQTAVHVHVYVDPHVGDRPVASITSSIASSRWRDLLDEVALCRGVAPCLNRLLAMAVYPLRLRPTNPIPRGWLPCAGAEKAKQ